MRKTLIVARAEYIRAVKTKAFIIGVLLMPILMGAAFIIIALAESIDAVEDRHFAVVDRSGELFGAISVEVEERNRYHIWSDDDPPAQEKDRFIVERYVPEEGEAYSIVLGDRVRDEELIGYFVIGADVVMREGDDRVLDWHTQTPTYDDVPDWLESIVNNAVREQRLAASGLDPALVAKVTRRVWVTEKGLAEVTETGEIKQAEKTDKIAGMVIPLVLSIMIYMLVMMSAPQLMNNVLEEKMQKIAEVLVASVPPFDLLLGKLLSALAVAMTLSLIYVGAGLIFVHTASSIPPTIPEALGAGVLLRFLFFEAVALIIYGSVFAALGSACTEIQDTQTLIGPAMLIFIMPMMFLGVVMKNPSGTVSQLISFFPPATPILMFLRSTIPPGVEVWELIVAMVLTVGFALLCVKIGAKIFRVGLLAQGQTANYRQILRWVMSK